MYLLFLDESGTHGAAAPVFVLAGIAIHERDAVHMAKRLDGNLTYRLAPLGLNANDFELHAKDIKAGKREWGVVPAQSRFAVLGSTYNALASYSCLEAEYPVALFGAVVDARYADREKRAYELVLNKFDEMLDRIYRKHGARDQGLVIHDKCVVDTPMRQRPRTTRQTFERKIQEWTTDWQDVAGRVGRLYNLAHVPLFADSKATRLVQSADFVAWC